MFEAVTNYGLSNKKLSLMQEEILSPNDIEFCLKQQENLPQASNHI
jgi:hypothetical protein